MYESEFWVWAKKKNETFFDIDIFFENFWKSAKNRLFSEIWGTDLIKSMYFDLKCCNKLVQNGYLEKLINFVWFPHYLHFIAFSIHFLYISYIKFWNVKNIQNFAFSWLDLESPLYFDQNSCIIHGILWYSIIGHLCLET